MQPKLKEQPREWLKFTAVMTLMLAVVAVLLHRRRIVSQEVLLGIGLLLALVLAVCAARPRWFRGFYRAGMTISFHVGQVIGRALLTLFFLLALTPLGLLLRLFGKDLLNLRRKPAATTYWQPAKTSRQFDRQF